MLTKDLLIIANTFPDESETYVGDIFVKEQIRFLRKFYRKITVVVPIAFGIEVVRKIKQEDYTFEDIDVHFARFMVLPFFYNHHKESWIRASSSAIIRCIEKNNIRFDIIHAPSHMAFWVMCGSGKK